MSNKRPPLLGEVVELYDHEPEDRGHFLNPMSAMVTMSLDWFWAAPEFVLTVTVVGLIALMVAIFVVTAAVVAAIQLLVDRNTVGSAIAKGIGMGIVAGVPYPLTGTVVGGALLLPWAKRQLLGDHR